MILNWEDIPKRYSCWETFFFCLKLKPEGTNAFVVCVCSTETPLPCGMFLLPIWSGSCPPAAFSFLVVQCFVFSSQVLNVWSSLMNVHVHSPPERESWLPSVLVELLPIKSAEGICTCEPSYHWPVLYLRQGKSPLYQVSILGGLPIATVEWIQLLLCIPMAHGDSLPPFKILEK